MRIAIITGASSGIGREFCRAADAMGFDQIWAVARRKERLEELADELSTPVAPLVLDLADPASIDVIATRLAEANGAERDGLPKGRAVEAGTTGPDSLQVALLVNAAGFAKLGTFMQTTRQECDGMIAVNCRAMVDLTRVCVPYMARGSRLIETVSMASFQPLPHLNVYAATKAFMLSYTRSLRWELGGTGIHATALCPGWVKTEFAQVSQQTAASDAVRHQAPAISAKRAVRWSLFVNRINFPVATCGLYAWITRVFSKFVPHPVVMLFWEGIRRV